MVNCQFSKIILKTYVAAFPITMALTTDKPIHQSKMYTKITVMKKPSTHLNNDFKVMTGKSVKKCKIPKEAYKFYFETLKKSTKKFSQSFHNKRNCQVF